MPFIGDVSFCKIIIVHISYVRKIPYICERKMNIFFICKQPSNLSIKHAINQVIMTTELTTTQNQILSRIFTIRGVQMMLDKDLAIHYALDTKVLNQTVKRNLNRFPERFMFQLTLDEWNSLKSQVVTSSLDDRLIMDIKQGI